MKEFGIPMKLVRLLKMTLANTNNKVEIQGKLSPNFEMAVGLQQGDSLSILLLNFCMENIIRNIKINLGGTIVDTTRPCLAYADDVVNLGQSVRYINDTLDEMAAVTPHIGLQKNNAKTKYMINRYEKNELKEIDILGNKYEKVESFKYINSVITSLMKWKLRLKVKLLLVTSASMH
jgi:hypothetical protein